MCLFYLDRGLLCLPIPRHLAGECCLSVRGVILRLYLHNFDITAILNRNFIEVRNMKKAITIIGASIAFIVLVQSGVLNSLLAFLIAGAIPGTSYNVSSAGMFIIIVSVVWLTVFRLITGTPLETPTVRRSSKKAATRKKRSPKARYKQA